MSLLCFIALSLPVYAEAAARLLENPTAEEMFFIAQRICELHPDFEKMAKQNKDLQRLPHLDLDKAKKYWIEQRKQDSVRVQGVMMLHVRSAATLSDYDPAFGEFVVGQLNSTTAIEYEPVYGPQVHLRLVNGTKANSWSVAPDRAHQVMKETGASRAVTIRYDIKITGCGGEKRARTIVNGSAVALEINAEIERYSLYSSRTGKSLGLVTVSH